MEKSQQSLTRCCLAVVAILSTGSTNVGAMSCTTVTSSTGSRVQCSHHRLTRFPVHLPHDVVWLDLSNNFLTSLGSLNDPSVSRVQHLFVSYNSISNVSADAFTAMSRLQTLDLSHNALGILHGDAFHGPTNLTTLMLSATGLYFLSDVTFKSVSHLVSLDLSSNSLSSVPATALQPLTSLQRLDLSSNALTTIDNHSLHSLSSLQHLSLRSNQLTSLQSDAFDGLHKLTTLDLRFNRLRFDLRFPSSIFVPLVSLTTLEIHVNHETFEEPYPMKVFDPLHSLKTLSIDTHSDSHFGAAFTNLTSLENLKLNYEGSGCNLERIANDTFTAFHYSVLQTLNIGQCPLLHVDLCAFCHLPHLTTLVAGHTHHLKISSLLLALYGVQNQTLEEVSFVNVRHFGPTILDGSMTLYLNNVCIEYLSLRQCDIVEMSRSAFQFHGTLLKCLKHVDLSRNLLPYGIKSMYMRLVMGMINLESFEFQEQQGFTRGSDTHYHRKSAGKPLSEWNKGTLYLNTAPSLKYFNTSSGIRDIGAIARHVHVPHGGNMSVMDVSYCGAMNCDFFITGLTRIHTFDFSGNDCYIMGHRLFQNMSTLRTLRLSDVYLQEQFLFTNGTAMLKPLGDLDDLDLSLNRLRRLPTDLLKHQPHLKRLVLARNQFESVPVDLSQLRSLQDFDVSDNQIHILSRSNRDLLDGVAANHSITLRLRGNPLSCTCQGLDMVRWLGTTTVRLDGDNRNEGFDDDYDDNGRDYPCVLEDGSMSSTWSVLSGLDSRWRQCVGLYFFTLALVAQLLQLLAILLTYVLCSHWTYLKHVWYVLRHVRLPRRVDFDYDALVVYASDDLQLALRVKRIMGRVAPRLRLALPEDEIPAGTFHVDDIADCIERSWKVLVLVTEDFLQDGDSSHTVLQAQASLSTSTLRRVLLLYHGDVGSHTRPGPAHLSMRRLLRLLPESHVYHLPADVTQRPQHPVWSQLAQAVLGEERE